MPQEVEKENWDIILVDAPAGWGDQTPGRMKSIFIASQLAANYTDVFVHDCDRIVEKTYSHTFLKQENLKTEIQKLRHYNITA